MSNRDHSDKNEILTHKISDRGEKPVNIVNVEQNINVVNIDAGKHSLFENIDMDFFKEWLG